MEKKNIHLGDIRRILFGDAPMVFLWEVFVKTILIYIVMLVIIRLLGKRMSGQLTSTELALTIMFGAIISSPMQTPGKGILMGIFILLLILVYHSNVARWSTRSYRLEQAMMGKTETLVRNGVLQLEAMRRQRISREELFSVLRSRGIYQLGEVGRVYIEPTGAFSVYKAKETRPGLCTLPLKDETITRIMEKSEDAICFSCGQVAGPEERCGHCHSKHFEPAVTYPA
jgi:uncharacterized membrane protein YcaP (DUF421 family)